MKQILSLLLAFVFFQTQCWALSGGPVYPGSSASVSGIYSGVLIPTGLGSNALGLFTLESPETGLATGQFVVFASGSSFIGEILGLIDPDKLTLNAVAEGEETVQTTFVNEDGTTAVISRTVAIASGQITATLVTSSQGNRLGASPSGVRLEGTGFLSTADLNFGGIIGPIGERTTPTGTIDFLVDGFKQVASSSVLGGIGGAAVPASGQGTGTGLSTLF